MFVYYLQLALWRCRRDPGTVVLLVLTLAIGIASFMTSLMVFTALTGQPLPGISNHLYVITMDARGADAGITGSYDIPVSVVSRLDTKALIEAHRAHAQVGISESVARIGLVGGTHFVAANGLMGYGPIIDTFGVPLRYGRTWTPTEQAARDPVILIDTRIAQKLFGVEDAVGRSVLLGKHAFRVIGITAPWKPRARFLVLIGGGIQRTPLPPDRSFFVPAGAALEAGVGPMVPPFCPKARTQHASGSTDIRGCRWLETWVKLDSPASVTAYQTSIRNYADAQHASGRFVYPPHPKLYGTLAWMDLNHIVPGDVSLNVMLSAAFLLLCLVNAIALMTARSLRRKADVAIRRALGATRSAVFAQQFVECGLLGIAAGLVALPLTLLGIEIVRIQPVSYAAAAQFNAGAFLGLLVLALVMGLVTGIVPAWSVCRRPPAMHLKVG